MQMVQVRIRWNTPAIRQSRLVVNQRPAETINDESIIKLAATNHLASFIHVQLQLLHYLAENKLAAKKIQLTRISTAK